MSFDDDELRGGAGRRSLSAVVVIVGVQRRRRRRTRQRSRLSAFVSRIASIGRRRDVNRLLPGGLVPPATVAARPVLAVHGERVAFQFVRSDEVADVVLLADDAVAGDRIAYVTHFQLDERRANLHLKAVGMAAIVKNVGIVGNIVFQRCLYSILHIAYAFLSVLW